MGVDKDYLDRQLTSADPVDRKSSVRCATTTALSAYTRTGNVITANANGVLAAQDGVTLVVGNSILLTDDGTASNIDNGIYVVTQLGSGGAPFILTRRGDANADDLVNSGMRVAVEEGTQYQPGTEFVLVTPNPIVLNTTALDIQVASGGGVGTLRLVNTPKRIPSDASMLFASDVVVEDGNLDVEGDIEDVEHFQNHSIKYVPIRSERVVQEDDEMLYTDGLTVDGQLVVDGQLTDATPYDFNDITAILSTDPAAARAAIGMVGFCDDSYNITAQDVNGAATGEFFIPLPEPSRVYAIRVNIMGYDAGNDLAAQWIVEITAKRNSLGTVTLLEELYIKNFAENINWGIDIDPAPGGFDVEAVGDVGNTVEWRFQVIVSGHG
jgi:hypothetical protein